MTTYGSLFSGVGGFDLGCDAAGWDCAWQVEWDAKCRSVLARHWPNVNRYEDVRHVGAMDVSLAGWADDGLRSSGPVADVDAGQGPGSLLEPVDIITFGFPCQDLSVAGKRAGLDGERSGLFFEAIRIIREMREATGGTHPRVAIAENVLGLLNADGGAAMGRCLDALAEVGALGIEWRVLDAQWFGVPQRRRRVFLVAVFDPRVAGRGPVFPEPESVRRHSPSSNETGEAVAGTLGGGSGNRGWAADTERMTFVADVPRTCGALTARGNPEFARDAQAQGFVIPVGPDTDRMTFVPDRTGTVTTTWAKGPGNTQVEAGLLVPAFVKAKRAASIDDDESWRSDAVSPTLNAFDNGGDSRATIVMPTSIGVRRLTPRECERLMGWPDDHTRYAADGTEIADSSRYRMCGNGVAAPVAKYVAECVDAIL
jgi:DNA (cytosine-5)-methyltransferase 1